MLNDLVARAFVAAGVPVAKEPVGWVHQDGKRPGGFMLIPFEVGRYLSGTRQFFAPGRLTLTLIWLCRVLAVVKVVM